MTSAQGRDYSDYQKPVTLSMLTGLSFAYTRVSNWQPPDYTIPGVDPHFAGNWREIKAAGLHRGAYWYLLLDVDPVAQARFFFNAVVAAGLEPGDMLVCDSEVLGANADSVTHTFCGTVAALAGPACPVLVYTNNNVGQHLTSCTGWPLWFAWPSLTAPPASLIAPWKTWLFWQWGEVANVDADAFNGTPGELDAWVTSHIPAPAPAPAPAREDLIMLATGAKAQTIIVAPPGAKAIWFGIDNHLVGQPAGALRVVAKNGAGWDTVSEITIDGAAAMVSVALPTAAEPFTVSVQRSDAGNSAIGYLIA
jgi:hypothetical protein